MYEITAQAVITGDLDTVWEIMTDVKGWSSWDPHELDARLDGPFVTGTTGWSKPRGGPATTWTLTEVQDRRRWASECGLPGGTLSGVNTFDLVGDRKVRCVKTVHVTGPLVPLFRLYFGPRIRRDMLKTFTALQAEASRRAADVAE
ncbi:SRPBCC family protein [Krasilnikovia sp. MM14-A1259]|uniref:SRPBCC family protein n=1 Tax=Krasilnikovia sp. MM14-A1259 TaxID=3373539 RepID=UPI00382950F1